MMFTGGTHSRKRSISNSQKRHGPSNQERGRPVAGPSAYQEVWHELTYVFLIE